MPRRTHLLFSFFLGLAALRKPGLSKQIYSICVISSLTPVWTLPVSTEQGSALHFESTESCYVLDGLTWVMSGVHSMLIPMSNF